MRTVEPFRPEHLASLKVQHGQLLQLSPGAIRDSALWARMGPAYTGFVDGSVIGCSGVITGGTHIGLVWAAVAQDVGRHMLWLHRAVRRYLDAVVMTHRVKRLEATVEEGFEAGCRWIELLGFRFEGRMPWYGLNGETHLRYARIA